MVPLQCPRHGTWYIRVQSFHECQDCVAERLQGAWGLTAKHELAALGKSRTYASAAGTAFDPQGTFRAMAHSTLTTGTGCLLFLDTRYNTRLALIYPLDHVPGIGWDIYPTKPVPAPYAGLVKLESGGHWNFFTVPEVDRFINQGRWIEFPPCSECGIYRALSVRGGRCPACELRRSQVSMFYAGGG